MTASQSSHEVSVARLQHGRLSTEVDRVAREAPLEIRLHGRPFSVTMRTPGADRDLVAGFLFAEGVIADVTEVASIETDSGREDVIHVNLAGRALDRLDEVLAGTRRVVATSACGMCGRVSLESLDVDAARADTPLALSRDVVLTLPARLRSAQHVFDETGGLHAAALFAGDGTLTTIDEDVGRHNAVDKVIGRMLLRGALPLVDRILFVSGRTSFEIVQKALLAGIPVLGAVSAPSSMAVELALTSGMTLLGFVRGDTFNVYAHPQRFA